MTLEEQAAKAIYEARNGPGAVPWNHQPKGHRDPYLADARAAIAIIRPAVMEEAAKVAEWRHEFGSRAGEHLFRDSNAIAATLRSLSEDRP